MSIDGYGNTRPNKGETLHQCPNCKEAHPERFMLIMETDPDQTELECPGCDQSIFLRTSEVAKKDPQTHLEQIVTAQMKKKLAADAAAREEKLKRRQALTLEMDEKPEPKKTPEPTRTESKKTPDDFSF